MYDFKKLLDLAKTAGNLIGPAMAAVERFEDAFSASKATLSKTEIEDLKAELEKTHPEALKASADLNATIDAELQRRGEG